MASEHRLATVDRDNGTGHPPCSIPGEEGDNIGYVLDAADSLSRRGPLGSFFSRIFGDRLKVFGPDHAGTDAVDSDPTTISAEFLSGDTRESLNGCFAAGKCHATGVAATGG